MRAPLLLALCAAVVLPVAAGGDEGGRGAASASASASATAYARSGSTGQSGYVTVRGDGSRTGKGTSVTASTEGGEGSASARAAVRRVNIFGGLVTSGPVEVRAGATGGRTTAEGSVEGLAIQGRQLGSHTSAETFDMAGYGTLEVLGSGAGGITALRATLTKDYKRFPAGASVAVAYASARAKDGPPPAEPGAGERERPATERSRSRQPSPPGSSRGRARAKEGQPVRRPAKRRRAPDLDVLPTGAGYAFPVHGDGYSFSDDYGAPRQHTGSHEGNDVFAPEGTPVLAVTDGVLYRVGTRTVPGNRMWLRNSRGDTFFYAHLSAFAHDARNGARVRAGDVIGFVGATGDAEKTPPHLHFEIHPEDGDPVNPYPFLRAWEERRDVPAAAWLSRYGDDPGSRPGALVVIEDYLQTPAR